MVKSMATFNVECVRNNPYEKWLFNTAVGDLIDQIGREIDQNQISISYVTSGRGQVYSFIANLNLKESEFTLYEDGKKVNLVYDIYAEFSIGPIPIMTKFGKIIISGFLK